MSENKPAKETKSKRSEAIIAQKIERQKESIAKMEKALAKKPSDAVKLDLLRGRDALRNLLNVQKTNPKKRADAKYKYAAKSALSRAIQAVEE